MMDKLAVDVGGVHLTWQMLLAGFAAAQWAIVALIALVAPVRVRKALAISTAVFAAGWLFAFDVASLFGNKTNAAEASAVGATTRQGTCALIQNDMTAEDVRKKIGQPDEIRNDDAIRGPGSATYVYRDLRCAVHLFDDKVELVD